MIMIIVVISIGFSFILPLLAVFHQESEETPVSSLEPFECGMEGVVESRLPLSIHFLFIGVLFLVFDIEIILVIPMINVSMNIVSWWFYWFLFSLVMQLGIFIEITFGSLDWIL